MLSGNVISTALLLISCVTGLTGTSRIDAKQATYSFADVAHTGRFDLAISSMNVRWYREGMQLFAYRHNGYYWKKRKITWTVLRYDEKRPDWVLPKEYADKLIEDAFKRWAAVIPEPFTFKQVSSPQADIQFTWEDIPAAYWKVSRLRVLLPQNRGALDHSVPIRIIFDNDTCWLYKGGLDYFNFRFAALHAIGQALGLDQSDKYYSVMNYSHERCREMCAPSFYDDDLQGIQALYRGRSSSEPTTQTYSGMYPGSANQTYRRNTAPSSSSSSTAASSSSSASSDASSDGDD